MTVDVLVSCPAWTADLPDAVGLAENAIGAAAAMAFRRAGRFEVSVLLTDDATQRRLNRTWRGQDRATNVLAFPAQTRAALDDLRVGGPTTGLGDVVLAHGTVRREAEAQGKALADHMSHLLVHGFLHLIGYEHEAVGEAERMEALEVRVLGRLGIADPYAGEATAGANRYEGAVPDERARR